MARGCFLSALIILVATRIEAATYTVTNTNDSGAGSLRQAILDANSNSGADVIAFNIAGGGVHTISPGSALPKLTFPVTIDGYTQPGSSVNTNPPDQGLNSVLRIEIDCTNAGTYCLVIGADNVTLRGLAMHHGVGAVATDFLKLVQNPVIEGCFLGTSADGLTPLPLPVGITFGQHKNARIGGTAPAARNLLAGDGSGTQIEISNASDNGSVIQGNLFCTDKTGLARIGSPTLGRNGVVLSGGTGAGNTSNITIGGLTEPAGNLFACSGLNVRLANMHDVRVQGNRFGVDPTGTIGIAAGRGTGVYVEGGDDTNVIGGTAAGAANVMGSMITGIACFSGAGAIVHGNFIGTDTSGTKDIGNKGEGVVLTPGVGLTIGGTGAGEANWILHNRSGGVRLGCCSNGNTIRGNRIFDNLGLSSGTPSLGINLVGVAGPEVNDPGDPDTGGNDLQNSPHITSASPEGGGTRVIGTLDSTASSSFTLDFYANPICRARPRAQLQADQYLGSTVVSTNASGVASFNVLLPAPTDAGQPVTATATNSNGSTSELSPEIVFSSNPIGGSPAGGDTITIRGMSFAAGATVTIGGAAATNVVVDSATRIFADAPPLPAGTVHDVVVTMPGGLTGTLRSGYVSRFSDSTGSGFDQYIATLRANAVTAGCGVGNYCPASPVTRAQMAVFLLRGKKGLCYLPPAATGTVFADVPANGFAAAYIEALAAAGVTGGCGSGNYCPNSFVTRAQMAVFLLRTLEGPGYVPSPCTTATFSDVPCSNGFSKWINELVARGITAGCGSGNYCPANAVTRGQMAVFISTTFGLP